MVKFSLPTINIFRSFQARLTLVISILFFIVAIAYYLYTISMQRSLFRESFSTTVRNLTESIKLGIEVGLSEENYQSISKVFAWAKKEQYLSFIILTDDSLNIVAQYPEERDFSSYMNKKFNESSTNDSIYILSTGYSSHIVQGRLIVGCSTQIIKDYEKRTLGDIGLSVAGVLILAILLISLVTSGITRPLNNLKAVTDRIAKGDLIIRANEIKGGEEITSVSKAFNQMVDVLINTRTELEKDLIEATEFVKSILP